MEWDRTGWNEEKTVLGLVFVCIQILMTGYWQNGGK